MDKETQSELSKGRSSLPVPSGLDKPIISSSPISSTTSSDSSAKVSTSSPAAGYEYQQKFAEEVHTYVKEYIRNADHKAAFIFAFCSSIFNYLRIIGALDQ